MDYVVSHTNRWQQVAEQQNVLPFDADVLGFINDFSACLMRSPEAKQFSELVALGFWLRHGNIKALQKQAPDELIQPLGLVVHYTPANVDTMFIYSWICALLLGNNNIVRIASQQSPAQQRLFDLLSQLMAMEKHLNIAKRNCFVRYPKEDSVGKSIAEKADGRVIWGGDDSVTAIRSMTVKADCRDIIFADRYSISLINGAAVATQQDVKTLAERLQRDSFAFDQQACSSPRVVFWLGCTSFQPSLLDELDKLMGEQDVPLNTRNNHLVFSQLVKSSARSTRIFKHRHCRIIQVDSLTEQYVQWHTGGGMYLLVDIDDVSEIAFNVSEKLQTLSYWGVDKSELLKLARNPSIKGLSRVVPVGQALDFGVLWDGYNVFSQLCRTIDIR